MDGCGLLGLMLVQKENFIEWGNMVRVTEELLGIPFNSAGIWNCPLDGSMCWEIDREGVNHCSGYMQGESKFIIKVCTDPLCGSDYKNIRISADPKEFIVRFGKSAYSSTYPQSIQFITFALDEVLEFLVVNGKLIRGENYWIFNSW